MLSQRNVYATIPASDLSRALAWYEQKLGLTPRSVEPMGAIFDAGGGTGFLLYPTTSAGQAPNTLMTFGSKDLRADVTALRAKGVVFEDYDFPGLRTVDGVAKLGNREGAWFKDSEGNILALGTQD
jgi:predicted enzyme related to lactoylglutathione lyase